MTTLGYCQECGDSDVPVAAIQNPAGYGMVNVCERCLDASAREMALLRELGADLEAYADMDREHESSCSFCRMVGKRNAPLGGLRAACLRNRRIQEGRAA